MSALLKLAGLLLVAATCSHGYSPPEPEYLTLDHMVDAYKTWSSNHRPEARQFISRQAEKMAEKLRGLNISQIFSQDMIRRLGTPLSHQKVPFRSDSKSFFITDEETISNMDSDSLDRDAGATTKCGKVVSPFFHAALPGVPADQIGWTIYDAVTAEVNSLISGGNPWYPDITKLLQALLLVGVEAAEFSFPEVVKLVADALGEVATVLDPVPEYMYDDEVLETDGSPVKYHPALPLENYAGTLMGPQKFRTYYPISRTGVVNIVKKAKREDARVRASGLRHSWNHWIWGVDNRYEEVERHPCYEERDGRGDLDYVIAMIPYELSNPLFPYRFDLYEWQDKSHELTGVEGPLETWTENGTEFATVKFGAAAVSQFLTDWALENGYMLPSEPMLPIFTLGGVVSTSSHGSGRQFGPVSQYVVAMEYVDEKGEIQVVDDPWELDATTASYGLFGPIISLTFRMNKFGFVRYEAQIVTETLEEYIPRPGLPIPDKLRNMFENAYYQTWFASVDFGVGPSTGYPQLYQNTFFQNDSLTAEDAQTLITPFESDVSIGYRTLLSTIFHLFQDGFDQSPGSQDYLYWMYALVERQIEVLYESQVVLEPRVTTTAEAIHWIRGLHNYDILRNFEINIPVRDDGSGNPDWSTIQEIFWLYQDVVDSYERYGVFPHDAPVELRFVSGSTRLLDAYYGNVHGTFSMDISCTPLVPNEIWTQFRNDMAFRFARFNTGGLRRPRHHFAKEQPIQLQGMSSKDYFKSTYADQIDMFRDRYQQIVESRGSSMRDSLRRFSTKFFDQVMLQCLNN